MNASNGSWTDGAALAAPLQGASSEPPTASPDVVCRNTRRRDTSVVFLISSHLLFPRSQGHNIELVSSKQRKNYMALKKKIICTE